MATELKRNPTKQGVIDLGDQLIGIDQYNSGTADEVRVIREITTTLLSTPGHAQYFADELERIRSEDRTKNRQEYRSALNRYLRETLIHLPSPETVRVLGNHLNDLRDAPPPEKPGRDWDGTPFNPDMSAWVLSDIGIRDEPFKHDYKPGFDTPAIWRAWWEEVKAGRKTLSFVGQKVEYRFKPDGTWDTIPIANPPDDAPGGREAGAAHRPVKRPPPDRVPDKPLPRGSSWAWIIGAVIAALGGVFWFRMRKVPQ